MKKFATDSPVMFAFQLEGVEGTFSIPRMESLPVTLSARFADIFRMDDDDEKTNAAYRLEVDILAKYLPPEAMDAIDARTMGAIFEAYMEQDGDANPGE